VLRESWINDSPAREHCLPQLFHGEGGSEGGREERSSWKRCGQTEVARATLWKWVCLSTSYKRSPRWQDFSPRAQFHHLFKHRFVISSPRPSAIPSPLVTTSAISFGRALSTHSCTHTHTHTHVCVNKHIPRPSQPCICPDVSREHCSHWADRSYTRRI